MSEQQSQPPKAKRGFAAMTKPQRMEIASNGGKKAHARGVAWEWTQEQAREAGRKGGLARAAKVRAARETLVQLEADYAEHTDTRPV